MDFHAINYLYPFFVLAVLNALLCTAIVSTAGWLTKNKMVIYLSGLFIYILYMAVSLYSNSPLFANASPVSAGMMSMMAKLDPFGMAAFFEQTKTWTPLLRNTQLMVLEGNLLFNRIAVLLVSGALLYTTCRFYRFTLGKKEKNRHIEKLEFTVAESIPYKLVNAYEADNPTPFRLESSRPGMLSKLALRECQRKAPADNEVQIEVKAAGLNFRDVLKALNLYPGVPKAECGPYKPFPGYGFH